MPETQVLLEVVGLEGGGPAPLPCLLLHQRCATPLTDQGPTQNPPREGILFGACSYF